MKDEATRPEVFGSSFYQPAKAFFVALPKVTARVPKSTQAHYVLGGPMNKNILCALILACIVAVALAAQTQDERSDIDVLVTASRVEEPVEGIPAYVSVITAEELSASGQTTLVEALESLAGIHFRSFSGNPAQAQISMRGFGENSFGRVLVLIDGRRLNRPDLASINWLEIPVKNVDRIEVVRGGSSVLYGDNAVAGAINIITKKGAPGFDVAVSAQYGSFNQNQAGVEVSGTSEVLSYSITGERTATDGYRDRSAFRSLAFGGSIGIDLERLSSGLSLSYNRLFYELPGALTQSEFDTDPTQAQPGHDADEALGDYFNADLSCDFSPAEGLLLDGNAGYGLRFIRTDLPVFLSFTDLILHTAAMTPKLKLDFPLLAGNRLVVGIDGYYDYLGLKAFSDVARTSTTLEGWIGKATIGFYATDDLSLLRFLTASAGLRYELVQITAKTLKTAATPIDESKVLHGFVYEAGLNFTPFANTKFWVKYGTVFRYPFTDEIVDFYGFLATPFNTNLDPERGYSFDVGFESQLFGIVTLATNAFWLDMEDEIAVVETSPFVFINVNQDSTRHLGIEAELGITIERWLDLLGSYTFTLATYRAGTYEGNQIPLVPVHQVFGEAVLLLPLGFSSGVSAQYTGDQFAGSDFDNDQTTLPGYLLLGAFVRFSPEYLSGKLDVYFGVNNLLDTHYATTGFYSSFSGEVSYYPGEGRNWKVGASYRY
jgi:iron complex outermembrane receptor protein